MYLREAWREWEAWCEWRDQRRRTHGPDLEAEAGLHAAFTAGWRTAEWRGAEKEPQAEPGLSIPRD